MYKVLTEIISCGILPALSQHILRASELDIIENPNLMWQPAFFERLMDHDQFELLSWILPMCTGQNFFQTLCTRGHAA